MNYKHVLKFHDEIRMAKSINNRPLGFVDRRGVVRKAIEPYRMQSIYDMAFKASVHHAVTVDVQNICGIMNDAIESGYPITSNEFPRLRLPYAEMWFEFNPTPISGIPHLRKIGVLARCLQDSHLDESVLKVNMADAEFIKGWKQIEFVLFVGGKDGTIIGPMNCLCIDINETDEIQAVAVTNYADLSSYNFSKATEYTGKLPQGRGGQIVRMKQTPYNPQRDASSVVFMIPAIHAIQFMNCKNVIVEDKEPPTTINERHRRDHPPMVKYKVLRIDRKNKATSAHAGDVQNPGIMPYHICRGHFKHFTKEKPLLGKFVGTYWWEAQARGNRKQGEVIKDYAVDAPPTTTETSIETPRPT